MASLTKGQEIQLPSGNNSYMEVCYKKNAYKKAICEKNVFIGMGV